MSVQEEWAVKVRHQLECRVVCAAGRAPGRGWRRVRLTLTKPLLASILSWLDGIVTNQEWRVAGGIIAAGEGGEGLREELDVPCRQVEVSGDAASPGLRLHLAGLVFGAPAVCQQQNVCCHH